MPDFIYQNIQDIPKHKKNRKILNLNIDAIISHGNHIP